MKTPVLGSAYVARSVNAADNRMINIFPEIVPEAGKEPAYLQRAPGLRLLATVGDGPIRGLWHFGDYAYVVSGVQVFKIDTAYTATLIGTVSGTGPVSMADNGGVLFIACNGPSYTYYAVTGQFDQITDPNFPGASVVGFLDGYFVFTEPNSQRFYVVSSQTPTSYIYPLVFDPTDVSSAEGSPDGLVSLIIDHREAWLFGTTSVEVWVNVGLTDFPLQRIQGAFNEIGCAATHSVAKLDNGIFWLGADARGQGMVYRGEGYTGKRISTHAVEWQIQSYGTISDAVAYTYQQDGHSFYVLIFPTAGKTWVYDVSTGAWHERAGWSNGQFVRHRSNCMVAYNDEIIVGDYANGKLYAFDLDVYADDGQIQKWLRSWRALPTGQNNLKRTTHHSLQLDCETGVGLVGLDPDVVHGLLLAENGNFIITENDSFIELDVITTQGVNPRAMLRWSDDGGHTWSNEHWSPMGKVGEYSKRVFWRRLGMTLKLRDRVYEVSGTDPVKVYIMGAELIISGTNA